MKGKIILAFSLLALAMLGAFLLPLREPIEPQRERTAHSQERSGWPAYRGGFDNINYSALAQINRDNVKELEVAWTLDTGDAFPGSQMQHNPIVVDGIIYLTSPRLDVIAADAATGREIWRFDPNDGQATLGHFRSRGIHYWSDGEESRLLVPVRHYLYALDARTGTVVKSFGNDGRIDLREHLDRDPAAQAVRLNTPGVIYRDLLIIGSTTHASYGGIRAYDVRTGTLSWKFHTIPRPGEFGYDTWPEDAWRHAIKGNAWGGLTLDKERGIVYAPTAWAWEHSSFDLHGYYAGGRAGDNLFANTLLALNAATGDRLWHYQVVRHDTWDRDLPTAPSLVTVTRGGERIDAVAQPTKNGYLFVFDRETGTPLFPIEEMSVPTDGMPGEALSPTQPVPVKPRPFTRQAFTEEMITRRTPEAHAAVLERFRKLRNDGAYTPMSLKGSIVFPGLEGGASWGGAAYDPDTGLLYLNANEAPWILRLEARKPASGEAPARARELYLRECASCHGADLKGTPGPPLSDVGDRHDRMEIFSFLNDGSGMMPSFSHLGADALHALANYLMTGEDAAIASDSLPRSASSEHGYRLAEVSMFHDPEGYPAIEPPWGTLSAIDLNSGEYAWQIPLGEYPELAEQGITDTGTQNVGGPVVTAGGLVFIGATIFDRKFRAFDKESGELLWETTLPAAAHATPAIYKVDGRQFVVIAAGGGKARREYQRDDLPDDDSGSIYIAFALPEK